VTADQDGIDVVGLVEAAQRPTASPKGPMSLAASSSQVDETWRLLHLLAASYWLGGLITLAILAVVAHRALDDQRFASLMAGAGRAFLAGSLVAWLVIAVSGAAMAASRLKGLGQLLSTAWGRTLDAKTGLALVAVLLTVAHTMAGRRTASINWVRISRILSLLILLATIGIFYLAVRLTEG